MRAFFTKTMVKKSADIQEISTFLLDYAIILLRSGANTERTIRNTSRIGAAFGYDIALAIFQKSFTMTISDISNNSIGRTYVKKQLPAHVSFTIVNDLSALSWEAYDTDIELSQVIDKYHEVLKKAHTSNGAVIICASIANAAFCRLFGGDWLAMAIVFISTLIAFSVRFVMIKQKIDLRAAIVAVSFIASMTAWALGKYIIDTDTLDVAISASVLFLTPGVHIINAVTDVLDGHVLTGIARGVNSMILVGCIAIGLYAALSIIRWGLL